MLKMLGQKLSGYQKKIRHDWNLWQLKRSQEQKERLVGRWISEYHAAMPEVLVGANFALGGGVRNHILALKRFSQLRLQLLPSDELLRDVGQNLIRKRYNDRFQAMDTRSLRAVHSHVYPWFIDWCQAQQKRGAYWIHTYHLNYYPEHADETLLPWQQEFNEALMQRARHADLKISVSKWQVEELRKEYGIDCIYVPNGVDVEQCDRGVARRFVDKVNTDDFILWVGRDEPVKNPREFIELAIRMPEHTFVIIGKGIDEKTVRESYQLPPPPNLILHGPETHLGVQDALAACRCLVVTSKREGLPTLILEAMAHRKAIVAPDELGCVEAIDYGKYGYIYPLGDLNALVEQTRLALQDITKSSKAREHVLNAYDWRAVMPHIDRLYRQELHQSFDEAPQNLQQS